jgi:hypothetical protein
VIRLPQFEQEEAMIKSERNGSNFWWGFCRNWDQVKDHLSPTVTAPINTEHKVVWKLTSDGMFCNTSAHKSLIHLSLLIF